MRWFGGRYTKTLRLALLFALQLWLLKRTRVLLGERHARVASALYTRQARRFARFARRMGGLIVKVGQFMSVRIDLLPAEYIEELSHLQDAIPPVPTDRIIRVIEQELDGPLTTLFSSFETTPLAAASLGQVHRATLPDGTPVAVKVLRPGIDDLVATDLRALRDILHLVDRFIGLSKVANLDTIEAEFAATFTDELDYIKEGHNAETFQRNLLMNPNVDIPKIYWERTTKCVLTMEFMDGMRIDDLEAIKAAGINCEELAIHLSDVYFQMILDDGFFHADPHPGNVFVRSDGVIQLIDFGMIGTVTEENRAGFTQLVLSMVNHDAMGIVRALRSLGFLGPGTQMRKLATMIEPYIASLLGDVTRMYTSQSVVDAMMTGQTTLTIDDDKLDEIQRFIYTQPIVLPAQIAFLGKALITVVGVGLRLYPQADLLAVAAPHVAGGGIGEFISAQFSGVADLVKNFLPNTQRLVSTVDKIDDGTFEVELAQAVHRRVAAEQRRQTNRLVKVMVGIGTVLGLLIGFRRR